MPNREESCDAEPMIRAEESAGLLRVLEKGDHQLLLDLTDQVLAMDVASKVPNAESIPLVATLADLPPDPAGNRQLLSAAMLMHKSLLLDDGVCAAVEVAAQALGESFGGTTHVIKQLIQAYASGTTGSQSRAAAVLFAAGQLAGLGEDIPPDLAAAVARELEEFEMDPARSRPVGYHAWTEELASLYRQDQMLQTVLKKREGVEALARILHQQPTARHSYEAHLDFMSQLHNPQAPESPDLRGPLAELDRDNLRLEAQRYCIFPASHSYESDLARRLYLSTPLEPELDLMAEVVAMVRKGQLKLRPRNGSGWYDLRSWSLEPFLRPEYTHEWRKLRMTKAYTKCLEDLFKGDLILTRESGHKRPAIPGGGSSEMPHITVSPKLTVEPLCTHYLRRAIGYGFLRIVLTSHFGRKPLMDMHRLGPDGPRQEDVDSELRLVESLFYGAFVASCEELGLSRGERNDMVRDELATPSIPTDLRRAPRSGSDLDQDLELFREWSERRDDPDLAHDNRAMEPVYYDVGRQRLRARVFLGWARRRLKVSFAVPPHCHVLDRAGRDVTNKVQIDWRHFATEVAYPVTADIYVSKLLGRTEFQDHCDEYGTATDILESLTDLPVLSGRPSFF